MKYESKPHIIILSNNLYESVRMLAEDDLSRQINMSYNMLIYVYFKNNNITNTNLWKNILKTKNQDVIDRLFPEWPNKLYPKTPPKCKKIEIKFIKLCLNHYKFLLNYSILLCEEYERRYNKVHIKMKTFNWISEHLPRLPYVNRELTIDYPIRSIPLRFRKKGYIDSARNYYKWLYPNPIENYMKTDIPEFLIPKNNTETF